MVKAPGSLGLVQRRAVQTHGWEALRQLLGMGGQGQREAGSEQGHQS